jgi:hypothetical protein
VDSDMEVRIRQILDGIEEDGPEFDVTDSDPEAQTISRRWNVPVETVVSVKYVAEHGPFYEEMLDNAYNAAEWYSDPYNLDGAVDESICVYGMCDGYESEPDSHIADCPYRMAVGLLGEWRQKYL